MIAPNKAEKILIFKWQWLELVLDGRKTLEIRSMALRSGRYFLGFKGEIFGWAEIGNPMKIESVEQWEALRRQHLVALEALPYRKTYGLPILRVKRLRKRIAFAHPRGAIGIVRLQ